MPQRKTILKTLALAQAMSHADASLDACTNDEVLLQGCNHVVPFMPFRSYKEVSLSRTYHQDRFLKLPPSDLMVPDI